MQWNDRSTGNHNVTDVNPPAFTTDARNYNPGLDFDGTNDEMVNTAGGFYMAQYYMVFVADDVVSSSLNAQTIVSGDNFLAASYDHEFALGNSTGGYVNEVFSQNVGSTAYWRSGYINSAISFPAGTAYLFNVKESLLGLFTEMYQDGVSLPQTTGNVYLVESDRPFMVGNNYNNDNQFFDGKILEIICYSSNNSDAESQMVESYLAVKYGITLGDPSNLVDYLSSSGSTIWTGDMRYQNDIIGIGRDDLSGLLQKQSKTDDDTVRIYLNSLTATNQLNASTASDFGSDEAFVLLGSDGGQMHATLVSLMEKPASVYSRLEREWKLTNTNFTGTYSMDFVISGSSDPANVTLSDLRLLVDTDSDFSDANAYSAGLTFSYSAGVITVSGISTSYIPANSTRYITIGSANAFTPLPVELFDFKAIANNTEVDLFWSTLSEVNNDYFMVERSSNGIDWFAIANVDGAGNSSIVLDYTYVDREPLPGVSYYRLRQIDHDGSESISGIRKVKMPSISDIHIYPNPFSNRLIIEGANSGNIQVEIRNSIGQVLICPVNDIGQVLEIETDHLPGGIYFITIKSSNEQVSRKLIKK